MLQLPRRPGPLPPPLTGPVAKNEKPPLVWGRGARCVSAAVSGVRIAFSSAQLHDHRLG